MKNMGVTKGPRQGWVGNSEGMSLIEVLIAAGALSAIALVFATFSANFGQETRALSQKAEILDYTRDLQTQLLKSDDCTCQFIGIPAMNTTSPSGIPDLDMPQLKASCGATAPILAQPGQPLKGTQTGLRVRSLRYTQIVSTGNPNEYMGYIETAFEGTVRNLQPSRVRQRVSVDPASPLPARRIIGCISNNTPTCRTVRDRGAPPEYVSYARCASDEYVVSGGGHCAIGGSAFSGNLQPDQKAFLHFSGIADNGWEVDCFESTKTSDAVSEAWALCCKK
jgi:hypothetical protein